MKVTLDIIDEAKKVKRYEYDSLKDFLPKFQLLQSCHIELLKIYNKTGAEEADANEIESFFSMFNFISSSKDLNVKTIILNKIFVMPKFEKIAQEKSYSDSYKYSCVNLIIESVITEGAGWLMINLKSVENLTLRDLRLSSADEKTLETCLSNWEALKKIEIDDVDCNNKKAIASALLKMKQSNNKDLIVQLKGSQEWNQWGKIYSEHASKASVNNNNSNKVSVAPLVKTVLAAPSTNPAVKPSLPVAQASSLQKPQGQGVSLLPHVESHDNELSISLKLLDGQTFDEVKESLEELKNWIIKEYELGSIKSDLKVNKPLKLCTLIVTTRLEAEADALCDALKQVDLSDKVLQKKNVNLPTAKPG